MRPRHLTALVAALASALGASPLRAQQGSVNMTVLAVAAVSSTIKVRGMQDLLFGTVIPGVEKSVPITGGASDTQVGIFSVDGTKNAEVQIDFNLPNQLVTTSGSRMSIDRWVGCFNVVNSTTGCTPFVPGTPNTRLRSNNGKLWVWLGGTVMPTATQGAGTYRNTIQMTVLYTGN